MIRHLYSLLLWLLTPAIWARLLWRSRKQPEYLQHLGERWGIYPPTTDQRPCLWVHAVSVGETRAAQPLIEHLLSQYPGYRLLLTGMTPTGRQTGHSVYGDRVMQAYLPYDMPGSVRRFLRQFRPSLGILMETEIWPNLLHACRQAGVPVVLANARLSARSARGYQRFAALTGTAFASLYSCAAQTAEDAERLRVLGTPAVTVCGNLKFDVTPSTEQLQRGQQWRQHLGSRPVWLAASTREGEEPLILAAYAQLPEPRPRLLLVPRHPQRFAEVGQLLTAGNWRWRARSSGLPEATDDIWLGDSMGEMVAYYAAADLAFIGGSLLPLGGQNLIEACACGCPVVVGPHTFNFTQATQDALAAGAARRVETAAELAAQIAQLFAQPEALEAMRAAARSFATQHQGATLRVAALLAPLIAPLPGPAGR